MGVIDIVKATHYLIRAEDILLTPKCVRASLAIIARLRCCPSFRSSCVRNF